MSKIRARGIGLGTIVLHMTGSVRDNTAHNQFEIALEGGTAFLKYERTDRALTLIHTEVPPALRGHHLGERLVEAALQAGRSAGLAIVAVCPFVKTYMRKHPQPPAA